MKPKFNLLVASLLLATTSSALATVRYVNVNNANPTPPYTNWATAAVDIQSAVDAAAAGDQVVVTNGIYAGGNGVDPDDGDTTCVVIDKPLTLQSVNGPGVTIIDGGVDGGGWGVRCAYLTNNALLVGFTLTNGWAGEGGGICCESTNAVLANCVLTSNSAIQGGAAYGGTLSNCTLSGNGANDGGGAYGGTLNNCVLTSNSADQGGAAYGSTLNNCVVSGNSGDGTDYSTLNNCTITGNSGWGASSDTLNNCIVYFNSDTNGGNYDYSCMLNYCCTSPLPTNGVGNISADPQLASASYLSPYSPCIGAGSAAYASGTDIDGDAWNNPPSIGCGEYHAGAVTGALTVSLTATYTNVTIGFPVGLTALIAGQTDLSVWDFGDGDVRVNEPYTAHTWTSPGDYLVALWAFSDSHPEGVSATVTVRVENGLHYVAANSGNPVAPYISWGTAATIIQAAVNAAGAGGTIFVTNGTYAGVSWLDPYGDSDCVVVDKPLTMQSVNGPDVTVIDGGSKVRCVYLANNAVLVGFTLTNGWTGWGGGTYGGTLNNCTLTGNSSYGGGGAYGCTLNKCVLTGNSASAYGGGGYDCTMNNCTMSSNSAFFGGGAYSDWQPYTLNNCTLTGNSATSRGGGAEFCTLNNCTLTGNSAYDHSGNWGGGAAFGGTLNNCTLTGNSATYSNGGGAYGGTLNNCTVINSASSWGGAAFGGTLNNCTLTGNSATSRCGGAYGSLLNNCIVYFNTATNWANYYQDQYGGVLNYCCTTPMPTNGVGNITTAPLFVDYSNANLRLQSNSTCINSGNIAYVVGSTDLDGRPRIVGGTVDIGAYEFQPGVSGLFIGWLQAYGLPTDGSADDADTDGIGMNVYQDWVAGLNPTNRLSVLKMLAPSATNSPLGLVVSWQSVNTRTYYLQHSTKLGTQPAFITIQSNIVGQAGTTSYTDTTATNVGPYFYRVGVGQ